MACPLGSGLALPRVSEGISEPKRQIKAIHMIEVMLFFLPRSNGRDIVRVIEADLGTDHEHIVELVAQGNCVA